MKVMVWGVGAFTHGTMQVLKDGGAEVFAYLPRDYGHYGPSLAGPCFASDAHSNPCSLIREYGINLVIPMAIDWHQSRWRDDFLAAGVPIFAPSGQAMLLERDREFAHQLCLQFGIPFPEAHVARNRLDAEALLTEHRRPFVIKNHLCSSTSPVHTILCETVEDTWSWLGRLDYAEGVFLQEYMGCREAGHVALVSDGEIHSLVTNQEYKRAFTGDMGIVAGAPLGGIVEQDPGDKYGLARQLLHPLLPWFQEVNFHGPVQVTAAFRDGRWHVLEYNVRMGVTSGPMILRTLKNLLEVLEATCRDQRVNVRFWRQHRYGCSLTLAGFGYPYISIDGPPLPVRVEGQMDCDLWWNEVAENAEGELHMTGHRIADIVAVSEKLEEAVYRL